MTTAADVTSRIEALAGVLTTSGDLTEPRWREALYEVPRHRFVPDVAWAAPTTGHGHRIDRTADPEAWMAAAYADHPIVIQFDDGAADVGAGTGSYTSSLSAPGVVVDFLERLNPFDDDRVLEIGTGSGWTAGLLAHRVGDGNVTSVEVDPVVSAFAAGSLKQAGYSPTLVVGDGAEGHPDGAPYDLMHVTCGVTTVPYAWVEQTRPGGAIVMPWMPEYAGGHKLKLTVRPDGTASGRISGGCDFMMLRSQRSARSELDGDYRETAAMVDPRRIVWSAWGADVAIAGMLPSMAGRHEEGERGEFRLWLWTSDSDALVTHAPDLGRSLALQRGPRDLWQEIEDAYFAWVRLGEPGRDRFGVTVTPEGQQVWLDSPDRVIGPLA
ncbi:methyltransferase domain-containing protein [Actinomadura alba]|uniref:Protein-L-isoaspartate O-methyltransferase n=1 Tax=Actinomadura alba TaxID=406431 RepID=A0ABR7LJ45_9ACTN|nr:methyltransferase domain-containing protein [Actinomadura alba]MBC6464841.1 protein-L-isoaspartate(D-aspartate) O-methyltransferase [Actinomadura alba]